MGAENRGAVSREVIQLDSRASDGCNQPLVSVLLLSGCSLCDHSGHFLSSLPGRGRVDPDTGGQGRG